MAIHYTDVDPDNTYICGDCETAYRGSTLLESCADEEDLVCPACGYWFDYEVNPAGEHV